jgi:hypothetical protein
MTQQTTLIVVAALVIGIGLGALGAYYVMSLERADQMAGSLPVEPNNTVAAGPVSSISASSISLTKQDGTTATFSITADTLIMLGQDGQSGAPTTWDAITDGTVVLVNPSKDNTKAAETIIIVPASAVQ